MQVNLKTLSNDAGLFLYGLDGQSAIVQAMDRGNFHKSIFLDPRIRTDGKQRFKVPLAPLIQGYSGKPLADQPIGFIFHVSQCGSTLLARALDHPGRSLVLREPMVLRQMGAQVGAGAGAAAMRQSDGFQKSLPLAASMLGKRFEADKPVIVKANVPVNFIADDLMALAPETSAILQYFPIDSFVAAVMRSPAHEQWVDNINAELKIGESPWAAGHIPVSTAERAGAVWFAQMKQFEALMDKYPNTRSLYAAHFFDNPAETIVAASDLFGMDMTRAEADEIADSELFQTYSKNPTLDYDAEVRVAREMEARKRLASEIEEAAAWARAAKERHGLPDAFARPLIGEAAALVP